MTLAARRRRSRRTTLLLRAVAAALSGALCAPASGLARDAALDFAACPADGDAVVVLASPRVPRAGEPLRIIAVAWQPLDAALAVGRAGSTPAASSDERHGGTPFWWTATVDEPAAGTYRVGLGRGSDVAGCAAIVVADRAAPRRSRPAGAVWPVERAWDGGTEALYSAWVEKLFDDPLDAEPSWRGIGALLRDPERNLLFDHLGLGEDSSGKMVLTPDCADLPFFLRAYFAWKLGLPFGWATCSRGTASGPPRCDGWHSNLAPDSPPGRDDVGAFLQFVRRDVGWGVHSGTARTPAGDDASDLYPARLAVESVRPGTVYADPYGHTLVVVARLPQTTETAGLLLAVDAQPDLTVARKRFWRGNFLFSVDPKLGGAGFKNFRPIVEERGKLRRLSNAEIEQRPALADFSLEQYANGVEGFYDAMDVMLSPEPLDPQRAFQQIIDALAEQIGARMRSVANGEEYVAKSPGTIAMPDGAAIFETTGAWEDYATPSRDLRLLIAIDVVRDFPARVERQPERYALAAAAKPAEVRRALDKMLEGASAERRFTYRRSDGSEWTLTLGDVLARATALEMAYNPNDCAEVRWGATRGSAEATACRRAAPAEQRTRMERYREWFRERRRPPRA